MGKIKKVRCGIYGCGKHAIQSHVVHLAKIPEAEIVAVYDKFEEPRENFVEFVNNQLLNRKILATWGTVEPLNAEKISLYDDERKFLAADIDAVFIMTPDEFHATELLKAVSMGKHVFVEKPLAVDWDQLATVRCALGIAATHKRIVSSCHPRRFDPPYVWMKYNLDEKERELRELLSVHLDFTYHAPSKKWKQARGLLMDHVNHEIDYINFICGPSDFRATRLIDTCNHYEVSGVRDDKITFHFTGTRILKSKIYDEFIKFRFKRGEVVMDCHAGVVKTINHDDRSQCVQVISGTDYVERFYRVNKNFIDAILGNERNYLSRKDLYVNTAMSVALSESDTYIHNTEINGVN